MDHFLHLRNESGGHAEPPQSHAEQWQQNVDAMDRRQREAYPFLRGRSRLAVFPELKQIIRPYSESWEEENWDIKKAREYLAGFVGKRKVSASGRITLYHRPHYPGRKQAGKIVLVSYDPVRCEWFVTEQVEEEKTARTILEQVRKIGAASSALFFLDRHLGKLAEEKE